MTNDPLRSAARDELDRPQATVSSATQPSAGPRRKEPQRNPRLNTTTSEKGQSLIPENFDARFQRAFGLLAFSINRHLVDHMRRISVELSMDLETSQIWGTLAHMNVLPKLPLGANPMAFLDEMGRNRALGLVPIRLSQLSQITGLPRETVRRKLEALSRLGKVERTADGLWLYKDSGISAAEIEFTRKTVVQFLNTAQTLLTILDQVQVEKGESQTRPAPADDTV